MSDGSIMYVCMYVVQVGSIRKEAWYVCRVCIHACMLVSSFFRESQSLMRTAAAASSVTTATDQLGKGLGPPLPRRRRGRGRSRGRSCREGRLVLLMLGVIHEMLGFLFQCLGDLQCDSAEFLALVWNELQWCLG